MKDGTKPYMAEKINGEWIVTTLAESGIDTKTLAHCGRGQEAEQDAMAIADAMNKAAAKPVTFLAERAQLEQEWVELRHLKAQYKQRPPAEYPDLKTVAYMHATKDEYVTAHDDVYPKHRELVLRADVIGGYEAMRRDVAFWRETVDTILKNRPAAGATTRSDAEIVAQTEKVAALLALVYDGSTIADGVLYRNSTHPLAVRCWDTACRIQEILTATDVENALAELDEETP